MGIAIPKLNVEGSNPFARFLASLEAVNPALRAGARRFAPGLGQRAPLCSSGAESGYRLMRLSPSVGAIRS
jgi:hypothetical protein